LAIAECRLEIVDWRLAIDGLAIDEWGTQSTNRQSVNLQSAIINPSIGNRQSPIANDVCVTMPG
jgi:hypothetical protein